MKLIVKEKEHNIRLRFPTGLMLNRVTVITVCRGAKKHGISLTYHQAAAFLKALREYRRAHKEWVFVEVTSAKGEYVQIKL